MMKRLFLALLISPTVAATDMSKMPSGGLKSFDFALQQVVNNKKTKQEMVIISRDHVNRIVTPFQSPSLKLDSVQGVTFKQKGNVIYLSTSSDANIGGFITEKGDESTAMPVLFKPMPLPPQEILLSGASQSTSTQAARQFEKSQPRIQTIAQIMTTLAQGNLPTGYSLQNPNGKYLPVCNQLGLQFDFHRGQFVQGAEYAVAIGTVTNTSGKVQEIRENNCFRDGVVSVSAFPYTKLYPNYKSEVFVMFYRNKPVHSQTKTRKSLIN